MHVWYGADFACSPAKMMADCVGTCLGGYCSFSVSVRLVVLFEYHMKLLQYIGKVI